MRNLSSCPYWKYHHGLLPKGEDHTCTFGCWEEPRCITWEPENGWPQRHRERGPDGRFRKVES